MNVNTRFRPLRPVLALTAAVLLAACGSGPVHKAGQPSPAAAPAVIAEAFVSPLTPADNIDSLAAWHGGDGSVWLIATAKDSDQLVVYDGSDGRRIGTFGERGDGVGALRRPNGVFVIDDLLFVVERDNRRVQLLSLPGFKPLLEFGRDTLIKPYGLWVGRANGGYILHVTDAYETVDGQVPPLRELDRRVKRYLVERKIGNGWSAHLLDAYGDTGEEGALRIVESIWADMVHGNVLIAEEDETWANEIKVYSMAGSYSGRRFGHDVLEAQAEGIALYACLDGDGYWLTTAQGKRQTTFHLFDRRSFAHVGAFIGEQVANTDGVWLSQTASARFPAGAFYAVHDDQGVVGFDWRDIAGALDLRQDCTYQQP